jgi:hypothetical protein
MKLQDRNSDHLSTVVTKEMSQTTSLHVHTELVQEVPARAIFLNIKMVGR